mgnify:CR=1 FL=1
MGNMAQESGYTPTAVNSSSGAYGICQWLGSRYTNLENFAGGLGRDISDLEAQANFACMELSPDNTYDYCDFQWLSQSNIDTFKTSTDINEITEVIARGWERCGDGEAYMSNRISNANSAYALFPKEPRSTKRWIFLLPDKKAETPGLSLQIRRE